MRALLAGQRNPQIRVHRQVAVFAWSCHAPSVVKKSSCCQLLTCFCSQEIVTMHPSKLSLSDGCFMDLRELKGLEIAARTKIVFADGVWLVPSQTTATKYKVMLEGRESCECDDLRSVNSLVSTSTRPGWPANATTAARCRRRRRAGPKKPTYRKSGPPITRRRPQRSAACSPCSPTSCRHVPRFPAPRSAASGHPRPPTWFLR